MSAGLRVDPIACRGHGVCAELLPELISLDPWGYPLVASRTVPPALAGHARRAAAACPTLALRIEDGLTRHRRDAPMTWRKTLRRGRSRS